MQSLNFQIIYVKETKVTQTEIGNFNNTDLTSKASLVSFRTQPCLSITQ